MSKYALVIGMGLIGGSLAMAVRQHSEFKIIGNDVDEQQLKLAKAAGIIDDYELNLKDCAPQADFIIIAAPVLQTEVIIQRLSELSLKENVLIIDTGSTKQKVMKCAEVLRRQNAVFIGGHPMAGSHKSGIEAARTHLFENAFFILTPFPDEDEAEISRVKQWLAPTSARFVLLSPQEHDEIAGAISHFPHMVAAGLVHQIERMNKTNSMMYQLAAGGFRDITRIASSSPEMWRDILLHNKEELLVLMRDWKREMDKVERMVTSANSKEIHHYFLEAKQFRDSLPRKRKGAIPAFYDLYIDVPDHPGVISEVTGMLAEQSINLTNIRILEAREGILGVLRISFRSEEDRMEAQRIISSKRYDTFIIE